MKRPSLPITKKLVCVVPFIAFISNPASSAVLTWWDTTGYDLAVTGEGNVAALNDNVGGTIGVRFDSISPAGFDWFNASSQPQGDNSTIVTNAVGQDGWSQFTSSANDVDLIEMRNDDFSTTLDHTYRVTLDLTSYGGDTSNLLIGVEGIYNFASQGASVTFGATGGGGTSTWTFIDSENPARPIWTGATGVLTGDGGSGDLAPVFLDLDSGVTEVTLTYLDVNGGLDADLWRFFAASEAAVIPEPSAGLLAVLGLSMTLLRRRKS